MLTFDKVRSQVMQICGAHRGAVNLVIDGLIDVMINNLEMGHSVQLGEFGTIRPAIRAKAQENREDATADTIYRRRIIFVPGKLLNYFLNDLSFNKIEPFKTDYTESDVEGINADI